MNRMTCEFKCTVFLHANGVISLNISARNIWKKSIRTFLWISEKRYSQQRCRRPRPAQFYKRLRWLVDEANPVSWVKFSNVSTLAHSGGNSTHCLSLKKITPMSPFPCKVPIAKDKAMRHLGALPIFIRDEVCLHTQRVEDSKGDEHHHCVSI